MIKIFPFLKSAYYPVLFIYLFIYFFLLLLGKNYFTSIKVVGEPTGTSAKFVSMATNAVKEYFSTQFGVTVPSSDITQIALECEGKIESRVEALYELMQQGGKDVNENCNGNWIQKLKEADFVFVATHSQGTPVSVMLVDKLLKNNIISENTQRVSILAMAGISHGKELLGMFFFPYLSLFGFGIDES